MNRTVPFLILKTAFLLKVMSRFCQGQNQWGFSSYHISVHIAAAEAIVNVFFDARSNSSASSLFSVWDFTGCVFFAVYRSACAGVWGFAAVSYQTVRWWTVANLRYLFKKKKLQVAFLLSSSLNASSQALPKLSRAFIIFFIPFLSFKYLIIFAHLFCI